MSNKASSSNSLPKSVWILFIASVATIMGLSLIGPVLPGIAKNFHGSPLEISLMYTSYNAAMAIAMLLSGYLSSKLGIKKTLMLGLVFIGVFASCVGFATNLSQVILFRGLWGIGNAIFFATGFTATIALAGKARKKAISLFEAATGIGMAVGPFIGGVLGGFSWNYPFFAIGLVMILVLVIIAASLPRNVEDKEGIINTDASILDPIYALKNRSIAVVGLSACLYNFGFFALLAYAPLVMNLPPFTLGMVFLAFGVMVALVSYFISPIIQDKIGTIKGIYINLALFTIILILMAVGIRTSNVNLMLISIVIGGALVGNLNPMFSNAIVEVSTIDKASTSSSYSFLRFLSGGIAPATAGALAIISADAPFYVGGVILLISLLILILNRNYIKNLIQTNKKREADKNDDEKIYDLNVEDIMTSKIFIKSTSSINDFLKILTERKLSGLPVVDDNNALIGMISDGDVIRYFYPEGEPVHDFLYEVFIEDEKLNENLKDKIKDPVGKIMKTQDIFYVKTDDNFKKALEILSHHTFKQIPVLDEDNKVVGIINRSNLNENLLKHMSRISK